MVAGIGDDKVGNKAKESSDKGKYQAKTAKSKKLHKKPKVFWVSTLLAYFLKDLTHDQEFLAILEAPWIERLLFKALSLQQNLSFNLQYSRWALESFQFHIAIYLDSLPFQVPAFKLHLFKPPRFVRLPPSSLRLFSQALRFLQVLARSTPSRIVSLRPTPYRIFAQASALLR